MIINPQNKTFTQWAIAVAQQLGMQGDTVPMREGMLWMDWADHVLQLPLISEQRVARPATFANWFEWANAFNLSAEY